MQTEQQKPSPIEALRKYLAERQTWPKEKQEEDDEMRHGDPEAYLPRYRKVIWNDTIEAALDFERRSAMLGSFDFEFDEEAYPMTLEQASQAVAKMIRRLERETPEEFFESYNGLLYVGGLNEGQLLVEELAVPEPPEKIAKYF